jgi:hypothetical protein
MSAHLVHRALLMAALAAPSLLSAQIVRGAITVRGDSTGVPGVVVLLLDSAGATVGRALSDNRGEYRIVAPGSGTYRVRTMRVGFRPDTSAAIALASGQERDQPLIVTSVAARLDTVRIVDRSQCRSGDAADATAAVWDQARTGLLAAQMTARLRSVNAAIITYERTLDPNSERIREQHSGLLSGLTVRPWMSLSPDSLRKVGYVVPQKDGSFSYMAPDIDALLSPHFIADHCFKITRTRDTSIIGVSFEPGRDRAKIAEIQGTLWLVKATAELKRLEFRYANVPRDQGERAGGDMEFVRMKNGGFAIGRWNIKMPVLERSQSMGTQIETRVAELRAVGGELAFAMAGKDTLFARAPLVMNGTVADSVSGRAFIGAKVWLVGTNLDTAVTDARGRFTINGVLPGEYTIEVKTPEYEVINASARLPLVFAEEKTRPEIRLPSARLIIAARTSVLSGTVVDEEQRPIAGADVSVPGAEIMALTDEKGAFRLTSVPPGSQEISVRKMGYGPMVATLPFVPGRAVSRRVVLTRLVVLDTVVVEAVSDMAEFEANRKLGLGRFMTRADLEKFTGRQMSAVLSEIKGVGIAPGRGSHAYIQSTHATASISVQQGFDRFKGVVPPPGQTQYSMMRDAGYIPPHIYCPEDQTEITQLGIKCGCFAKVYLDKMLMNPEEPTRPFDVNTIPPEMIESIELYSNAAQAPMKYQARNAQCGVMVIHRRRTFTEKKKPATPTPPNPPA